jgi:hypothetical protein
MSVRATKIAALSHILPSGDKLVYWPRNELGIFRDVFREFYSPGAARVPSQWYAPVFAVGISALISFNFGWQSTVARFH